MDWRQLWDIASAPDNVPIVGLMPLLAFYIYLGWKQARANDALIGELETSPAMAKTHHRKTWPFRPGWQKEVHVWPFLLRIEFLAAIIVTIVLMVWSITLNAPLEEPANPNLTMNPAKAPWYFLGLQEMLVYFDPWIAGVVMPTLIIIGLMVIPYIDTNPLGSGYYTWKQRKFAIGTFLFGFIILWVAMIIIGTFIRGPGWQWFWPGQTWDHNRLIYEVNRDLPDLFGITSNLAKAIFGAVVVGGYYLLGGFALHALFRRYNPKDYRRMSLLQYSIMMFFMLTMVALPLKMLLRLAWHIKYVWITPWFNV
jgi:Cytochrome b(C-terminal)/b6/petD